MSYPDVQAEVAAAVSGSGPETETTTAPEVAPSPDTTTTETAPQQESAPPWQSFVEKFPTAYRGIAEEAAKEWDAGVTRRFQDLHSTYEPYKQVIEEWEPDAVQHALAITQQLNENPQAFLEALQQAYGLQQGEQGAGTPAEPEIDPADQPGFDPFQHRLDEQQTLLEALANHIMSQDQAKADAEEQARQDQWLEQTLETLTKEHGEYDRNFVLRAMAAGAEPEDAVKEFQQLVGTWAARQNAAPATAPRVMSAGGGLPSVQRDPATLNNKETKDLVTQILLAGG